MHTSTLLLSAPQRLVHSRQSPPLSAFVRMVCWPWTTTPSMWWRGLGKLGLMIDGTLHSVFVSPQHLSAGLAFGNVAWGGWRTMNNRIARSDKGCLLFFRPCHKSRFLHPQQGASQHPTCYYDRRSTQSTQPGPCIVSNRPSCAAEPSAP